MAAPQRRSTNNIGGMLGSDTAVAPTDVSRPTADSETRLSRLAYQRFEDRGREHGHDLDDWFEAERELAEAPPE